MVYKAIVLDNSSFLKNGTIRVRISKYFMDTIEDLSDDPSQIKDGLKYVTNSTGGRDLKHTDTDVLVFSAIGGGKDYGMFFLPQVNTQGIVLKIGDSFESSDEFLWLGSLFEMTNNTIKMPSDSMNNENGFDNGVSNMQVLDGALVIKLRSTSLADQTKPEDSKNDIDWTQSPIENLIVINKNKVLIEHTVINNSKEITGNSIITLDSDESKINFTTETAMGEIGVDSSGNFKLNSTNISDNSTVSINGHKTGIEYVASDGTNSTIITQESDSLSLSTGGTAIGIKKDSITLKSTADIYLDGANEVHLGPTNMRVVLAPNDVGLSNCTSADGVTLTFSDKVFG